jgi:uncharacterized membrane protein
MTLIKAFLGALVAFLVLDGLWIYFVVRPFYDSQVGDLLRETPRWIPAALFYLAYIAGVIYLAVRPGLAASSLATSIAAGACIGALAYGTFTLTNYSVLKQWTLGLVWTDIAWGTFLTAVVAAVGHIVARP